MKSLTIPSYILNTVKVSPKKGFTLVELLVVISIISLLSSVVYAALNSARIKARDAVRMSDMREFTKALALYNDTYGIYPCGDKDDPNPANPGGTEDTSSNASFLNDIHGNFAFVWPGCGLATDPYDGIYPQFYRKYGPEDPKASGSQRYWYYVTADRRSYVLTSIFEGNATIMQNDGGICAGVYDIWGGDIRINHC